LKAYVLPEVTRLEERGEVDIPSGRLRKATRSMTTKERGYVVALFNTIPDRVKGLPEGELFYADRELTALSEVINGSSSLESIEVAPAQLAGYWSYLCRVCFMSSAAYEKAKERIKGTSGVTLQVYTETMDYVHRRNEELTRKTKKYIAYHTK